MFERAPENRMPVVVITNDGETILGSVRMTLSNKLSDAINGDEPFFDFVSAGGERFFIAKHSVRRVETFEAPRADQLGRREKNIADFDPHQVLGLARGAPLAAIKQAYHKLARAYHPDRFAGIELPPEMHEYATAMLARINLAYRQLQNETKSQGEVKSTQANGSAATAARR